MFWGLNFWSNFESTSASKCWRVVKILTTGQNISNGFDSSIFWVNVFLDKTISHTRSKIQSKFWCQYFASIYWRPLYNQCFLCYNYSLLPPKGWMELIAFSGPKQSFGMRDNADCKQRGTKWRAGGAERISSQPASRKSCRRIWYFR